ncbi:MAG: hypothetical protein P4L34_12740 [Paludibacter sp.]|nr:hypothetical protein [Paludibacter sp.]
METEDYINEYINREKQQEHNPYLATRIMEKIEAPKHKIPRFFQYTAVAASISIAVIMGIVIGDSYAPIQKKYTGLNINDSEIENFALYNSDSNE